MEQLGDSNTVKKPKTINLKIGFIGAGNMATAIMEGLVKSGSIKPQQIFVAAPSDKNLLHWKTLGANTTLKNSEVVLNCPIVILAVKPQYASEAIISAYSEFERCSFISVTLVSVLVGVTCDSLKEMVLKVLPNKQLGDKINIARTMPNTPLLVGEGCTVCCFKGSNSKDSQLQSVFTEHKEIVKSIFSVSGLCEEVGEHLINPIGALSGSGPAYMYQVIEALSDGAVRLGIPRDLSYTLAAQTLIGAAKMVLNSGKHPAQLKDEVCSPGGSTIAGISAMERNGVRFGLIEAIEAANQRTQEIANQIQGKI